MYKFIFFCVYLLGMIVASSAGLQADQPIDMPIFKPVAGYLANHTFESPLEQRTEAYRKFLSASLKITTDGGSGSGTIIYYDEQKNIAYLASCGHLWSGNMTNIQGQSKKLKCKVTTWYKNNIKLESPQVYDAEVIFYSNTRGFDSSLVTFKPDWKPNYFPIAELGYEIPAGSIQNSLGCDGAKEVARYEVEIVGPHPIPRSDNVNDLITQRNSPRPGRSGGGLLTNSGYYIGTCWGTSDKDGSGIGYFTPLASIHKVFEQNQHQWLLTVSFPARNIPIINHINDDMKLDKDYILIPSSKP